MSARYRNLNFLKKCGYEAEYSFQGDQATIDCTSTNELPSMILNCWGARSGIKGGTTFEVHRIQVHQVEAEQSQNIASRARIYRDGRGIYLVPDKSLLDELLPIVDPEGLYEYFWVLAQALLKGQKRSMKHTEAVEILEEILPPDWVITSIQHPLLHTSITNYLAFTFPEMLQYCLAVELNKRRSSSTELKELISLQTVPFLDIEAEIVQEIEVTQKKKEQFVREQKYEEAARIRDLEKSLQVEFLQKSWPNPTTKGAKTYFEERLKSLL